jgi:hypothetical protein
LPLASARSAFFAQENAFCGDAILTEALAVLPAPAADAVIAGTATHAIDKASFMTKWLLMTSPQKS